MTVFGRKAELSTVDQFLDQLDERAGILVLDGEAGIGKTTVWRAACDAAARRSIAILSAAPAESERTLSYASLTDLLSPVWDDVRELLPAPQRGALDVALLRAPSDVAPEARTAATGFVSALGALARDQHVLVAVDDAHWLDPDSRRVLEFAARRLPSGVGLLIAQRPPGREVPSLDVGRVPDAVSVERIELGPLSLAALHHALRLRLGLAAPRPLLTRVAQVSGGNPFYALELARASTGGSLTVPRTLHDLVGTRLDSLSPPGRMATFVAATLSRPTLELLARIEGEKGRAGVAEAAAAGVVEVDEEERIRFSHPLLATAVYEAAPPEARRSLHSRLATIVDTIEERARHLAASATRPDATVAAEVERGAEAAALRGAPSAAAKLYDAAARLTPPADVETTVRLLLAHAGALAAAGDLEAAREVRQRTLEAAPAGRLRALTLRELFKSAWFLGTPQEGAALLERALDELSDEDADLELARELRARLARVANAGPERSLRHAEAIISELDETAEPVSAARALIGLFIARVFLGRGADRELLERGLELERAASGGATYSGFGGGPGSVAPATGSPLDGVVLPWFSWVDDVERARQRWEEQDAWAVARGDDRDRAERQALYARLLIQTGDWETAATLLEEACETLGETGMPTTGPNTMAFAFRAYLDAQRGRVERAREVLRLLVDEAPLSWWSIEHLCHLGAVEFVAGEAAAAERLWERVDEGLATLGIKEEPGFRSEADRVEALVALGERERAQTVLAHLEWRGRTLPRLWIDVTMPRARAVMTAAAGDLDGSLAILREADEERMVRLPYDLARHLLLRGTVERRLKQKQASRQSLLRARDIFSALGATPWLERTDSELARVAARPAPKDLSETERRIAELAASGLTNREIAQAAFVSPKTVEANLARVYRKLGIRSRAELGARMAKP
ncbi:MAG TPA: AAA family ATPase [Gaiellaceae bacterium]|jgi:DNA-binding CsgD family transcriptional regulator